MLARHVSDLIGLSSGAFCTSCMCRLWYVVIRVLLDTSSRYKVVGRTLFIVMWMYLGVKRRSLQVLLHHIAAMHLHSFILIFSYIRIIFACWAVINLLLCISLCISLDCIYISKMIHGPYNVKLVFCLPRSKGAKNRVSKCAHPKFF